VRHRGVRQSGVPHAEPPPFPITIGITGHRDITPGEAHDAAVTTLLRHLKRRFHEDALYVLSALAQGADQLVADAAKRNQINLIAVLPMPLDDYRTTMAGDAAALAKLEDLLACATLTLELPWVQPSDQPPSHQLQLRATVALQPHPAGFAGRDGPAHSGTA
jgi:hypothetical protein